MARLLVALVLLATTSASAQPIPTLPENVAKLYREDTVIELVTMGIGARIWERHGHIALCVRHPDARRQDAKSDLELIQIRKTDECYNYGIGDFAHPIGMAWGFFRGTYSFYVGKEPMWAMLSIYSDADRTIWLQPLPLTPEQKKAVIDKLEFDILEPNRYYAYDHFFDNCTTRVRDIIDKVTDGKLSGMTETTDDRTFRDLAREGFFGMRIPSLITDFAMGRITDRVPTYWERMFLPQYLREAVAKLWNIQPVAIYERQGEPPATEGPSGRVLFALVIILLTSPAWITRLLGRFQRLGLALAVVPYALLGSIETILAIISPLGYVRWNETILVWLALDWLLLFGPAERRRLYARGRLIMLAVFALLLAVGVFHQPLWPELLWPAIPCAVVGFWPAKPVRVGELESNEPPLRATRRRNQKPKPKK